MTPCKTVLSLAVLLLASGSLALAQGTYTQFNVPGAAYTETGGIDTAGDIVGTYIDTSNVAHGFILSGGTYTTGINYPGANGTYLSGVNDVGQVVGYSSDPQLSFLYDIQAQTFTKVFYPNSRLTLAECINNAGTIAGYFNHNGQSGFELVGSTYSRVFPPGTTFSDVFGISTSGKLVGTALLNNLFIFFSFYQGKYRKITIPNAPGAAVLGINPAGTAIIGYYTPSTGVRAGFVFQNNILTTLQFPGANNTVATGINDAGEVVGAFGTSSPGQGGFTWMPPADAGKK